METGDKTAECLDIAAMKEGNYTLAADDVNQCVSEIECLCKWNLMNNYLVILNCRHHIVMSQIDQPVEPYSLSLVEILLSTCFDKESLW